MALYMKFTEKFNQNFLHYIVSNPETYRPQLLKSGIEENVKKMSSQRRTFLEAEGVVNNGIVDLFAHSRRYLRASNCGEIRVQYKFAKNSIDGRRFARSSLSLQNIAGIIRNTIAHEFYDDLDMVNAHPTILLAMCKEANIKCKKLSKYVKYRDSHLQELIETNKISRRTAKDTYLALMNGGSSVNLYKYMKTKPTFLKDFAKEMDRILDEFAELNPEEFKKETKFKDFNKKGSYLNKLICRKEDEILMHIYDIISADKTRGGITYTQHVNVVFAFDGMLVPKEVNVSENIKSIENRIYKKFNIPMKLKIKPMTPKLNIPDDIPEYIDVNPNNWVSTTPLRWDTLQKKTDSLSQRVEGALKTFLEEVVIPATKSLVIVDEEEGRFIYALQLGKPILTPQGKSIYNPSWRRLKMNQVYSDLKFPKRVVSSASKSVVLDFRKELLSSPYTIYCTDVCSDWNSSTFKMVNYEEQPYVYLNLWTQNPFQPKTFTRMVEDKFEAVDIQKWQGYIKYHIQEVLSGTPPSDLDSMSAKEQKEIREKLYMDYRMLEAYLYMLVNEPAFWPRCSIYFLDKGEGSGKGAFASRLFAYAFGHKYHQQKYHNFSDPASLLPYKKSKRLIWLDEMDIGSKKELEVYKNLVSEKKIAPRVLYSNVEDPIDSNACTMGAGNYTEYLRFLTRKQRRVNVHEVNDKHNRDEDYKKKMYDDMPEEMLVYYFYKLAENAEYDEFCRNAKFDDYFPLYNLTKLKDDLSVFGKFCIYIAQTPTLLHSKKETFISNGDLSDYWSIFCKDILQLQRKYCELNAVRNSTEFKMCINSGEGNNKRKGLRGRLFKSKNDISKAFETKFFVDIDDYSF